MPVAGERKDELRLSTNKVQKLYLFDSVHYPGIPLKPCISQNEIASDSASTPDVIGHKRRHVKDNYRACRPKSENKDRGYRVDVPAEVNRCVYSSRGAFLLLLFAGRTCDNAIIMCLRIIIAFRPLADYYCTAIAYCTTIGLLQCNNNPHPGLH